MQKGALYKLKSFNGTNEPLDNTPANENYWKLIGRTAKVVGLANEFQLPNRDRVLIQFDTNIESLGLECHNQIPNSLWILKSDLSK